MATQLARYTLYHDPGSICSIMARYTYALRGKPRDDSAGMDIQEKICSLKNREQLSEDFLCNISPAGEVPVLVPEDKNLKPIPDSLDITYAIADRYPSLLPDESKDETRRLLRDLHGISFFALTFAGKPEMQQRNLAFLLERLREEISERYRIAIEQKIESEGQSQEQVRKTVSRHGIFMHMANRAGSCRAKRIKLAALEPEAIQRSVDGTTRYLATIAQLLEQSQTGWILSAAEPTALDAHVVVFVCRLQDIKRDSLIPEVVRKYAEVAMAQPVWVETMKGQRTLPRL